jgi:hypothetical protein
VLGAQCGGTRWAQCRGTMWQQQWQHNVGAQSICGGIINLWGSTMWGPGMPCPHNHPMPSHAIPCPALPCCCHHDHTPTMPHNTTMLPCHDPPHALPLPSHATAAICCYLLPPMPSHALPSNFCPKFRKPTRWWEHSGGGTIEGIIWEHNVDTLWGYNGEAQCGGTMWRHNVGAQDGHNVGAQCGSNSTRWGHNVGIM